MTTDVYTARRHAMVETQLVARGIRDPAVLQAMGTIPREAFVSPEHREFAYEDRPLSIGEGQTISQPYIVALMTEALLLTPEARVLEIGTGSGYAAAVLSCMAHEVYTIERLDTLAAQAQHRLETLGYTNVRVRHANGTLGWPAHAPYDAIVVTAGGPNIPQALQTQLAIGGRLVMPVGAQPRFQMLTRVTRQSATALHRENLGPVCFVPLIGVQGWEDDEEVALRLLYDQLEAVVESEQQDDSGEA